MWHTTFIVDTRELVHDKAFPPFQPGGKVSLLLLDAVDERKVRVGYHVLDVCYDLESVLPRQYVYLEKLDR